MAGDPNNDLLSDGGTVGPDDNIDNAMNTPTVEIFGPRILDLESRASIDIRSQAMEVDGAEVQDDDGDHEDITKLVQPVCKA